MGAGAGHGVARGEPGFVVVDEALEAPHRDLEDVEAKGGDGRGRRPVGLPALDGSAAGGLIGGARRVVAAVEVAGLDEDALATGHGSTRQQAFAARGPADRAAGRAGGARSACAGTFTRTTSLGGAC